MNRSFTSQDSRNRLIKVKRLDYTKIRWAPLFSFLLYIKPIWYFNICKCNELNSLKEKLVSDRGSKLGFSSNIAETADGQFQSLIGKTASENMLFLKRAETIRSALDNYYFLRRHFHPFWSVYVLMLRLATFHNPIREVNSFFANWNVNRCDGKAIDLASKRPERITFEGEKKLPFVSVIIPTLNRYSYLKDVLNDLKNQDYPSYEVIIIDQSEPFDREFYNTTNLNLKVLRQKEKALWKARNKAIKLAKSDFILLFDDDSRVGPCWISHHVSGLKQFNADISSGVSLSKIGAKIPEHYKFWHISSQLDTGNVLIKRKVFETIGLFDRQFEGQRMGDGEFGCRAYLAGFKNISNPHAKRIHLKVSTGGLRQMGSWDAFRPKNIFAPRPIPSVLYYYRRYYGKKPTLFALLKDVPPSLVPYRFKRNKGMLLMGSLICIVLLPLVVIQVLRSWGIATRMIKEGPKIEYLQ